MSAAVSLAPTGYVVVDRDGRDLAYAEHFEDALMDFRRRDTASKVLRLADRVVLAERARLPLPVWRER